MVLIIIGLLAAIVIAAFANQQDKAHDADAKTHARSAQTAMESFFVDMKSYAGVTRADLEEQQTSLKDAPSLAIVTATSNEYEIEVVLGSRPTRSRSGCTGCRPARSSVRCSPADTGGCRPGGIW